MTQAFSIVREISRSVVRNVPVSLGGLESFSPADLFASGEDGGWYDPSDLTSILRPRLGASSPAADVIDPTVSVGDSIGSVLDKSKLGGRTVESYVNDPANNVWSSGISVSVSDFDGSSGSATDNLDGTYTLAETGTTTSTGYPRFRFSNVLTSGKTYYLEFSISNLTGATGPFLNIIRGNTSGTTNYFAAISLNTTPNGTTIKGIARAGSTTLEITTRGVAGNFSFDITNVKLVEIPGNHLVAPADIQRPVLREEIVEGTSVDVSGQPELVTNGTFDTDVSGWGEFLASGATLEWSAGQLLATAGTFGARVASSFSTTVNKTYLLTLERTGGTAAAISVRVTTDSGGGPSGAVFTESVSGSTFSQSWLFTATSSTMRVAAFTTTASATFLLDNVTVKEVPASAARRYYLDFDGTDDQLNATVTGLSATTSICTSFNPLADITYVVHRDTTTADYLIYASDGSSVTDWNDANQSGASARLDGATFSPATIDDVHTACLNKPNVITLETLSAASWGVFTVGDGASAGTGLDGYWYGTVLIDRALTTAERENLEIYLANKSGAVLA